MWDTVSKARIVRGDIESVCEKGVCLVGEEEIACDGLVACTGWESTYPMFSTQQAQDLGLPIKLEDIDVVQETRWEALIAGADKEVLLRFSRLKKQPDFPERAQVTRSARFYRCMVLTRSDYEDRSIVFLGHFGTRNTMLIAEVQALWAAAYLDTKLP